MKILNRFKHASILHYQDEELVKHVVQRTLQSKHSLESESIVDPGLINALLAISFSQMQLQSSSFRMIDLGGAAALLYETARSLWPDVDFHCTVIETSKMVQANNNRETRNLRFLTLSDFGALRNLEYDILIANSSLQYLPNPLLNLKSILEGINVNFLFIGKTPFSHGPEIIHGKQPSLLNSNGPKGLSGTNNKKVEIEAVVVPIKDVFLLIGDKWEKVYEIQDGHFTLKKDSKFNSVEYYPTKTLFFRHLLE